MPAKSRINAEKQKARNGEVSVAEAVSTTLSEAIEKDIRERLELFLKNPEKAAEAFRHLLYFGANYPAEMKKVLSTQNKSVLHELLDVMADNAEHFPKVALTAGFFDGHKYEWMRSPEINERFSYVKTGFSEKEMREHKAKQSRWSKDKTKDMKARKIVQDSVDAIQGMTTDEISVVLESALKALAEKARTFESTRAYYPIHDISILSTKLLFALMKTYPNLRTSIFKDITELAVIQTNDEKYNKEQLALAEVDRLKNRRYSYSKGVNPSYDLNLYLSDQVKAIEPFRTAFLFYSKKFEAYLEFPLFKDDWWPYYEKIWEHLKDESPEGKIYLHPLFKKIPQPSKKTKKSPHELATENCRTILKGHLKRMAAGQK